MFRWVAHLHPAEQRLGRRRWTGEGDEVVWTGPGGGWGQGEGACLLTGKMRLTSSSWAVLGFTGTRKALSGVTVLPTPDPQHPFAHSFVLLQFYELIYNFLVL